MKTITYTGHQNGAPMQRSSRRMRSGLRFVTFILGVILILAAGSLTVLADTTLFQPAVDYSVGTTPYNIAVGDFNGDSRPDLAVANSGSNSVSVLLNQIGGTFQTVVDYSVGTKPYSIAVGDFNGDSRPDLAVANNGSNSVSVLIGKGDGTFQPAVNYSVGTKPCGVAVGDFNGDSRLDLTVANYGSNSVSVLLGKGDGTFQTAVNYSVSLSPRSVAVGDFNGDGKPDLAVASHMDYNVSVLLGKGDGTFQPAVNYYTVGIFPRSVAVGDFNGDGRPDLAVANNASNSVSVLLGKGDGTFQLVVNYSVGTTPCSVAVGDFNGDGRPDLAVANNGSNSVSVLLGKGDGTFQTAVDYSTGTKPYSVAVGDFNGDGKPDLAVANSVGIVSVLLNSTHELTNLELSGTIPDLYVGGSDYNLNGLTLTGKNQLGQAISIPPNQVTWACSGTTGSILNGQFLKPLSPGAGGAVTATIDGMTSNPLNFKVTSPDLDVSLDMSTDTYSMVNGDTPSFRLRIKNTKATTNTAYNFAPYITVPSYVVLSGFQHVDKDTWNGNPQDLVATTSTPAAGMTQYTLPQISQLATADEYHIVFKAAFTGERPSGDGFTMTGYTGAWYQTPENVILYPTDLTGLPITIPSATITNMISTSDNGGSTAEIRPYDTVTYNVNVKIPRGTMVYQPRLNNTFPADFTLIELVDENAAVHDGAAITWPYIINSNSIAAVGTDIDYTFKLKFLAKTNGVFGGVNRYTAADTASLLWNIADGSNQKTASAPAVNIDVVQSSMGITAYSSDKTVFNTSGEAIVFNGSIRNNGQSAANNVKLVATIPDGMIIDVPSITAGGVKTDANHIQWDFASIAKSTTQNITFKLQEDGDPATPSYGNVQLSIDEYFSTPDSANSKKYSPVSQYITIGQPPVTVTGVAVNPATATVQKGTIQTFSATVSGTNNPAQTVTWTVYGNTSGYTVIEDGKLTVASGETANTLTVKATSTADNTKSGTATVTVTDVPSPAPVVDSVAVTPATATVQKGTIQTFSATVSGTNNPAQTVTWAVYNNSSGDTVISNAGLLTVASGETANTLTVKATSAADNTKSGTATVTVVEKAYDDGGSSSAPATTVVTAPTCTADVSGTGITTATMAVSVDQNRGRAALDLDYQQGNVITGVGNVIITVPSIPGVTAYTLGIPVSYLTNPDGEGTLTFNTNTGGMTLPADMLAGVTGAEGKKAEITISQGDKSGLAEAAKAAIGDRPLIELAVMIDGKQTDWNNPNKLVTISIPYIPTADELANPESIIIWYMDGSGNTVCVPNGHYDSATGTASFTTNHFSKYAVGYNNVSFKDVPADIWYSKAVSFIAARGITVGMGSGSYKPEAKLTRGEFLVMLMRAYGIELDVSWSDNFTDSGNTYYTGYLAAAKRLGISSGVGNNMFAPDKEITRQEMFTLLYNVLKVFDKLPQGNSGKSLSSFSDARQIDSWAIDAMTLLVKTGTIGGNAGKLAPTSTTTKAEMAQVLYNLLAK